MEIYEMENESTPTVPVKPEPVKKIAPSLSNEQQLIILKRWEDDTKEPPSIDELLRLAFPNEQKIDARSKQGILVKTFLVEKQLKIVAPTAKSDFKLSDEEKEYITNNCATMKTMEMARILFNDIKISGGDGRVKAVAGFLKTIDPKILYGGEVPEDDYSPPRTVGKVVSRIKKYVDAAKNWDIDNLTPNQKKQVEALMTYLGSFRFKFQIDSYENQEYKKLFEHNFIKYTYDKVDLTEENCDQYILLCSEIINGAQIDKNINMLQREQDRFLEEEGKISMAVVEAIKTAGTERGGCVKRQEALYKMLTQDRSDKLNERVGASFTLLNIVEEMKNEERRKSLVKMADERNTKIKGEIDRLSQLDETIVRIYGIDESLVING